MNVRFFFGVIIVAAVPLFFIGGPDWVSPLWMKHLWNLGHVIFFAALLVLIQSFKQLTHWRHWLTVSGVVLGLGIAIESLQYFIGRHASWEDLLRNLFGAWLGLFWQLKPVRIVWLLRIISLFLVLPGLWLVIGAVIAELQMRHQFPLINSFESHSEWQQIRFNSSSIDLHPVQQFATRGNHSLKANLGTELYSGFRLAGPQGNWSHYSTLAMDFYNPASEPFKLTLKISDHRHDRGANAYKDRFNRRMTLSPGWNYIRIAVTDIRQAPDQRAMEMDAISGIGLFTIKSRVAREFYLDNIRLE